MKIINFINPETDKEAYSLLAHCSVCGFLYEQTKDMLEEKGYYISEDQFQLFNKIIDIQIDLDIGDRQGEWK